MAGRAFSSVLSCRVCAARLEHRSTNGKPPFGGFHEFSRVSIRSVQTAAPPAILSPVSNPEPRQQRREQWYEGEGQEETRLRYGLEVHSHLLELLSSFSPIDVWYFSLASIFDTMVGLHTLRLAYLVCQIPVFCTDLHKYRYTSFIMLQLCQGSFKRVVQPEVVSLEDLSWAPLGI